MVNVGPRLEWNDVVDQIKGLYPAVAIVAAMQLDLFTLLNSATTAHAECAWVLWEQTVDLFPNRPVEEKWTIFKTHEARAACQADVSKLMHPDSAWRVTFEPAFGEDKVTKTIRTAGSYWTTTKHVICLPDTVDPRGPKPGR